MKRFLMLATFLLLLAAGCNSAESETRAETSSAQKDVLVFRSPT